MKKLLAGLMVVMLMLTGCKNEVEKPLLPEDDYNTEGERVVLYCGEKSFPISFTMDGKQKIENGTYFYYDLNGQFGRDWNDSFYLYHPDKLELIDYKEYGSFGDRHLFATNGNWPLFLNPVHSEFSASNQDQVDKNLIKVGKQLLEKNQMQDEPLIITDIWLCDMDKDGKEEHFFKASNYTFYANETKNESITEDELCIYSFLAYADGDVCQLLSGSFRRMMNEHGSEDASAVLSSTTYDEEGNLVTSVLKRKKGSAVLRDLRPIIADPDGDKVWSIYVCREGDFNSLTLMDFKDGNFTKTFEIIY